MGFDSSDTCTGTDIYNPRYVNSVSLIKHLMTKGVMLVITIVMNNLITMIV